jgi:Arc/MetJ-type ribon-helix-helix transcriptional regulator
MSRSISLSFSVSPQLLEDLTLVTDEFAQGNRSEFLRMAIRHFASRLKHSTVAERRAHALAEQNRITYTRAEIEAIVRGIRREKA